MRVEVLLIFAIASCWAAGNDGATFKLKTEFDQLKELYKKEDPEVPELLSVLEEPANWAALMNSQRLIPPKYFKEVIHKIHSFPDTVLPNAKRQEQQVKSVATEGPEMQKIHEEGLALQKKVLELTEASDAEDIADALVKWLLHLKLHEAFWQRRHYNMNRLLSILKYMLRRWTAQYDSVGDKDATSKVVGERLREMYEEIKEEWSWACIFMFASLGVALILLLVCSVVLFFRFRKR